MRLSLTTILLAGCVGGDKPGADDTGPVASPCVDTPMPVLAVDRTEVDFGTVEAGFTVTGTFAIENRGDAPLGVSSVKLGEGLADFDVDSHWGEETDCVSSVREDGQDILVIQRRCSHTVTVTYSPVATWGAGDAVVVWSAVAADDGSFANDPLRSYQVVWLSGRTAGEWDSVSYIAGDVISLGQTALYEGESTTVEVRMVGPDEAAPSFIWSDDDPSRAAFLDRAAPSTSYLAPAVDAPGQNENLYLVSSDSDGTDWAFGRVAVWDQSEPLYRCE